MTTTLAKLLGNGGKLININTEALIKYTTPQRSNNGWIQPKLSARQTNDLKKYVTRSLGMEWPIPEPVKKPLPERPVKLTKWERNAMLRQRKREEALLNMPKQIADKMKAAREKKKKATENSMTNLIPNFVKGGPYRPKLPPAIVALKDQAAIEKEKKIQDFIAKASKKATKGSKKSKK
eukprot:gene910-1139_t